MPMVVDASVTMAWVFEDEATGATEAVLDRLVDDRAVVPGVWPYEVANVLVAAERRRRVTEAQSRRFVELLRRLPIEIDASPPDLEALTVTGRRHDLSAYDAAYLVIAEHLGAPLATLDSGLARACREAGVPLLVGS